MPFTNQAKQFMANKLIDIVGDEGDRKFELACSSTREGTPITTRVEIGIINLPNGWEMDNWYSAYANADGTINFVQLYVKSEFTRQLVASYPVSATPVIASQLITFQQGTEFTIS